MVDKEITNSGDVKSNESSMKHAAVLAFTAMNRFRKSGMLCDIRLLADTSEFLAHKVVLSAYSLYFEKMFTGEFQESQKSIIKMNDIETNTMSILLDYFYTGNIELTVNNIEALTMASNYLQIEPLFELCCNFLLENMNPENCLGVLVFGEKLQCAKMKDKSKDYAVNYFTSVCQSVEFLELNAESLIDIIKSDSLYVDSEESVFYSVIQWFQYKENERIVCLPEVFRHVRLELLSPEFLKKHVETVEAISKSPECMQQIKEVENFRPKGSHKRRRNASQIEAILVYGEYLPLDLTRTDTAWKMYLISPGGLVLKELKQPKYFDYCYVSQCQTLLLAPHRDTIWRYNSNLNTWQPVAPLIKRRFSFGLCEVGDFWYAIGGFIPGSAYHTRIFNDVERYQPSSDVWVSVAPIPEGVMSPAVVSLQGIIYVLGGENMNGTHVNLVQRYDPRTNVWSQLPPFHVLGSGLKACGLYDRLYLFFDKGRLPIQVYNVSSNTWEECAQNKHQFASGPVVFDGNIYILSKNSNDVPVMERYSPTDGNWKDMAVSPKFRPQFILCGLPVLASLSREVNSKEECTMNSLNSNQ